MLSHVQSAVGAIGQVHPAGQRQIPVGFEGPDVLPYRGVKQAIRNDAMIPAPLTAPGLRLGRSQRRDALIGLHVLQHEPAGRVHQRDHVVPLPEQVKLAGL